MASPVRRRLRCGAMNGTQNENYIVNHLVAALMTTVTAERAIVDTPEAEVLKEAIFVAARFTPKMISTSKKQLIFGPESSAEVKSIPGRCWNECASARDYLCLACRPNLGIRGATTINSRNRSNERRNVATCRTSSLAITRRPAQTHRRHGHRTASTLPPQKIEARKAAFHLRTATA